MTVDVLGIRQRSASPSFIAELFRREPLYGGTALCLTALIAPTLVAMALDERTLLGVNVWLTPLRFEIALAVYLASLAWFAGWLPERVVGTRSCGHELRAPISAAEVAIPHVRPPQARRFVRGRGWKASRTIAEEGY
jgi:hypothetical protein